MPGDHASSDGTAWEGVPWTRAPVQVGPRFVAALDWAIELHGTQRKKGSDVPYVAHLLAVAGLVLDDGGSEKQAAAALLHDVLEDTDATAAEVRERFGRKVARIVVACSDTPVDGKRGKHSKHPSKHPSKRDASTWRARKERSIAKLHDPSTSRGALRVRAADALVNARDRRRPPAHRPRDVAPVQRGRGRPALVPPLGRGRAAIPPPGPAHRRTPGDGARDGATRRLVVRPG